MTHKEAVLKLLSDRKPHSHHELYGLGCVAHSRISDLRRDGWTIRQWREDGLYLYQLQGRLEEADPCGTASASSSTPPNPTLHGREGSASPSFSKSQTPDITRDEGVLTLFACDIDESAGLAFDEHDQATLRGAYWDDAA